MLRRHWAFTLVALVGIALRVMTTLAYRPVLLFPDSAGYLQRAFTLRFDATRPIGYSAFLAPIVRTVGVGGIATVQHLLGLAAATALYVFLLRKDLPPWAAALAVVPIAVDPLQLVVEQYALSDLLFQVVILAACLVLLWWSTPPTWSVVVAALLVGMAGLIRGAGFALVAPFAIAAVALRMRWSRVVLVALALIPYAAYAVAFHEEFRHYAIVESGPRFLYARIAPLAHCAHLPMPSYERQLCPSQPVGDRPDSDYYMWGHHLSAQYHLQLPQGVHALAAISDFDKRVIRNQPGMFVASSMHNFLLGFAPTRLHSPPGFSAQDWRFHDHYWSLERFFGPLHRPPYPTSANPTLARVLTGFQRFYYTPGPLLLALLGLAGAALVGLGRSRRSGVRVTIGLLSTTCLVSLATTAALSGPDWRYTLPQLALLPPAGALAVAALLRNARSGPAPWSPMATAAGRLGLPYIAVGIGVGVLLAAVGAVVLVGSGWFSIGTSALVGAGTAVLATVGTIWTSLRQRHDRAHEAGLV